MTATTTFRRQENLFLFGFFAAGALQAWIMAYHDQEFSRRVQVVDRFVLSVLVAYWVMRDAARHGLPKPFIFGLIVIFLWPILATWHVFRTRGWKGFVTVGIFLGLYLLSFAVPYVVFAFR